MRGWSTARGGEERAVELGIARPSNEPTGPVDQLRLRRLERENAELREQNEFLKRAALYFASERG